MMDCTEPRLVMIDSRLVEEKALASLGWPSPATHQSLRNRARGWVVLSAPRTGQPIS